MTANETRETCSIARCESPAVHSEHGPVGHWLVTIFYCDEHARQLREGTPLGPTGVEPANVRVEPADGYDVTRITSSRFPGIA